MRTQAGYFLSGHNMTEPISTLTASGEQPIGGLTPLGKIAAQRMWDYVKRESPALELMTGTRGSITEFLEASANVNKAMIGGTKEEMQTASAELAEKLPDFMPVGMVAWHGSPHKFLPTKKSPLGEFDLSKMGSGEGAQAYGWGTYLAEHPETAKFYSEAGVDVSPRLRMAIDDSGGNVADTIKSLKKNDPHNLLQEAEAIKGHLYEVDLPDKEIDKMLDWDKPFRELPEKQKELFEGFTDIGAMERNNIWDELELIATNDSKIYDKWYGELGEATDRLVDGTMTQADRNLINRTFKGYGREYGAKNILEGLESKHGKTVGEAYQAVTREKVTSQSDYGMAQKELSEKLRDAGIPGIKFYDAASRTAGEGTRNFVVFDPKKAKIVGRNGERIAEEVAKAPLAVKTDVSSSLQKRGIKGDRFLDAEDLYDDLAEQGAEISKDGMVTLYHRTSKEGAEAIKRTGKMVSREDRLFFGTKPTGQIEGYGSDFVKVEIPLEKLELNDVFGDEAHVTMKSGRIGTPTKVKVVK